MSDVENARAKLGQACQNLDSAGGQVGVALSELESTKGLLLNAVEGSSQADVSEAVGLCTTAESDLETARQAIFAAKNSAEGVSGRL